MKRGTEKAQDDCVPKVNEQVTSLLSEDPDKRRICKRPLAQTKSQSWFRLNSHALSGVHTVLRVRRDTRTEKEFMASKVAPRLHSPHCYTNYKRNQASRPEIRTELEDTRL